MANDKEIQKLIKKVEESKEKGFDLSLDEDLSIAVMNLVSIEEHFYFTAEKTNKTKYFDMLKEVREIRKEVMQKLVKEPEGEIWCLSKHLLAASMRLIEVGNKVNLKKNRKQAEEFYEKAFDLYSLFWALNMKIVDSKNISKIEDAKINRHEEKGKGFLGKIGAVVKRAIECCIE
ncbi:MAG: hypothetical protein WC080_00210 [Patescibacteria group bacterium]|jgi:hypothetical protein